VAGDENNATASLHQWQHGFDGLHLSSEIEIHGVASGFIFFKATAGIEYQQIEFAKGLLNLGLGGNQIINLG